MPTLDREGRAHQMFGICLVWGHEEDSPHKRYILGQWATHSWYYYTDSPVPKLPEWGGARIITIMAFYLCFYSAFLFGSPKVLVFFFTGGAPFLCAIQSGPHVQLRGCFSQAPLNPGS